MTNRLQKADFKCWKSEKNPSGSPCTRQTPLLKRGRAKSLGSTYNGDSWPARRGGEASPGLSLSGKDFTATRLKLGLTDSDGKQLSCVLLPAVGRSCFTHRENKAPAKALLCSHTRYELCDVGLALALHCSLWNRPCDTGPPAAPQRPGVTTGHTMAGHGKTPDQDHLPPTRPSKAVRLQGELQS